MFFDFQAGMGVTLRNGAFESLPVAHADAAERRLEKEIGLFANRAPLQIAAYGACAHQNRDDGGRSLHALTDERQKRALPITFVVGVKIDLAGDIDGNDRPSGFGRHHVHRQIVHDAAIDQQMPVFGDRRQNSRQSNAGAKCAPQEAGAMHKIAPRRQIGGDAKIGLGQIFDTDIAEMLL